MDIVSEISKKFSVSKPTVKKWLEGIKRPTYSMMPAIIRGFVEMIEELEDERDKYHRKAIEDCDRADRLVDELDNLQKKWTDVPDEYSDMGEFLTALKDMMFESEKDFEKMMDERDKALIEVEHLSQENSILNSEVDEADARIRAWEKFGEVIKWLYFCDKCLERNSERIENAFKLAKEALGKDDENE